MLIAAFNIEDGLRTLCAWLCKLIYWLIGGIFELFINVSKVSILSSDNIRPIYQRVTIVLAIVMVFYVTFELVKYVVQPDQMTDKEKGADKVVKKMIIVVLLIAFVPTVFSYSYKLQNIIIEKEVLPKMILGKSGIDTSTYGRNFSADMFSLFYQYDKDFWNDQNGSKMCEGVSYENIVLGNIEAMRSEGSFSNLSHCLNKSEKETKNGVKSTYYLITFNGLLAVIVGAFLMYVLVLYCIDVGTRVAQLAFLQIIAPIPIIGYLSPKKENIFTKWVKQCLTTYLDLFIRLAVIYFVLLVCSIISTAYNNGSLFNNLSGSSSRMLIYIVLILGLLLFAQKAPKMLQELFPKMGAASGNLGLKAGERVAPAAARAIGGTVGFTRGLVGGAIRRNRWRVARNKANGWATGAERFTRAGREKNRLKRQQIKDNKVAAREAENKQRSIEREQREKDNFDRRRNAWNEKVNSNERITDLKNRIRAAKAQGNDAEARRLGAELNSEYARLKDSKEYKNWNAARNKMAGSSMAQEMRQKNAANAAAQGEARDRMNRANASRDAAQNERDAALNRRNEVLRNRDTASGELAAAQQALVDAQNSGNADAIAAAQERVRVAEESYTNADKEAREVLGGRDAAVAERDAAGQELTAAQQALTDAQNSGNAEAIAAAQERVNAAQESYTTADRKVNEIVQNAAASSTGRAEVDAAYEELERAEAFGNASDIEAARRRVEEAERNYEAGAVFRERDEATRERDAAYEELERAENFGTSEEVEAARRRVVAAERNYETANNKIGAADKNYQQANQRYESAMGAADDAAKAYDDSSRASEAQFKSNRDFMTGNASEQYGEQLQAAKNESDRTREQVYDDRNTSFKGFAGSAVSTGFGAIKAGMTGAKATKLGDINKQVNQAVKDDIANVKAVQKYYDDGGTGWVDRTVQQVEKKIGMPTAYERTVLENHALEPKIKRLEAQSALTSDVKATADGAEDRLKDKINDLKLAAVSGTIKTVDENGRSTTVTVQPGETLGAVYRRYQGMEAKAQTDAETAAKRLDEFRASHSDVVLPADPNAPLNVEQQQLKRLQDEANLKATQASNAKYATTLVHKNAARAEFSAILQEFAVSGVSDKTLSEIKATDMYENVAVEKVYDALKSLEVARSNPEVVEGIRIHLGDTPEGRAAFDAFMSGHIDNFDTLDKIKTAAINAGNTYNRDAKAAKEEKRSSETSNQTSAYKAAQDYNGGNSGK